jgi:dienelactone hydrolase
VKERASAGQCLLGLRFTGDPVVPASRFETLRRELGDRFISVEIDSSSGNTHGFPKAAHSVLTEHFVDEPGNPTHDALHQVLAFFTDQLLPTPSD